VASAVNSQASAALRRGRVAGLALIAPALAIVVAFFIIPLFISFALAFRAKDGSLTLAHFEKSFELYTTDLIFTLEIVLLSSALIAIVAVAIAGYLTLGENPRAVSILRWLYRWPLFIPFVVTGQVMRTFLAKNGMLNHVLIGTGLIDPISAQSMLDWRGIVIAFVWKQAPFVTLLLAGAMASLEPHRLAKLVLLSPLGLWLDEVPLPDLLSLAGRPPVSSTPTKSIMATVNPRHMAQKAVRNELFMVTAGSFLPTIERVSKN
jgi:ABC-type spermidine/putrescine transport system permease subunit I